MSLNISPSNSINNKSHHITSRIISDVWSYFDKIYNHDGILIRYICKLCLPDKKNYASGSAITTLRRHFQTKHSETYSKARYQPYSINESHHITDNLVDWIISDIQPFSVVENPQEISSTNSSNYQKSFSQKI